MMTAFSLPGTAAAIRSTSSTVRRVYAVSIPAMGGKNGVAPGESTRSSYLMTSPDSVVTVCSSGSMLDARVLTRTSRLNLSLSASGVWSNSEERSGITPPTWYGRPQLAKDTCPEASRTIMVRFSSLRRRRVAVDIPPATPPIITVVGLLDISEPFKRIETRRTLFRKLRNASQKFGQAGPPGHCFQRYYCVDRCTIGWQERKLLLARCDYHTPPRWSFHSCYISQDDT